MRRDIPNESGKPDNAPRALTSQLLAFGRKAETLQSEILDLNSVITDMSSMLRPLIGEDIEFVSITQPGLGLVNADPGQIQQIVMKIYRQCSGRNAPRSQTHH